MIYLKIMELIKTDADELSKRVVKDLLKRGETEYHKKFSEEFLYERVLDVYRGLSHWLDRATPKEETSKFYTDLGRRRFHDEIPLHEVIMFLMLIKRHLWLYMLEKHFLDSSYELSKSLELNNRIVLFFDRAILAATVGYEEELAKDIKTRGEEGIFSKLFKKK